MSVAFQLPRSTRIEEFTAMPGQAVFGPVPWLGFDPVDVRVRVKVAANSAWQDATDCTVALTAEPAGFPVVTFSGPFVGGEKVRVRGARTHQRITDVTRSGALQTALMERELDLQAIVLQEQRRDIDATGARAILFPDDETAIVLPPAALREGKQLIFGVGGQVVLAPPSVVNIFDGIADFNTVAAATGATLPVIQTHFRTAGYYGTGDRGGALYRVVGAEPGHPGKIALAGGLWGELAERHVFGEMLGAQGMGGDDAVALQRALAVAAALHLGPVHLGPGDFGVGTMLVLDPAAKGAGFVGISGATRIFQIGSLAKLITGAGSIGAPILLTADAGRGASGFTLATTAGVVADDFHILSDDYVYDPLGGSANPRAGEMVRIRTAAAGAVTLYDTLHGAMASGEKYEVGKGAKLRKVNLVDGFVLEGVELVGVWNSTADLIDLSYYSDVRISKSWAHESGSGAFILRACRDVYISDCSITDLRDDLANSHVGYGVCLYGACDDVTVHDIYCNNLRHLFTTGGREYGVPRSVIVHTIIGTANAPVIDTHNAGSDILIHSCVLTGAGISIRSRYTTVRGNKISLVTIGHGINLAETGLKDVLLEGNDIRDMISTGHAIVAAPACVNLRIRRNEIDGAGADGIRVERCVAGLEIFDNIVKRAGLNAASRNAIIVTNLDGALAAKPTIMRNVTKSDGGGSISYGIALLVVTGGWVKDNQHYGPVGTLAFGILAGNETARNEVMA